MRRKVKSVRAHPAESSKQKTKRKRNEPLSVAVVNHHLRLSPTFIGTIIMKSFNKMVIQSSSFSFVVLCGSHYFAIYCSNNTLEIFDSIGFLKTKDCISQNLLNFINSHLVGRSLIVNQPVQSNRSKLCGYFVIFFIILRDRGVPFETVMNKFSIDKTVNDRIVTEFVNKLL